jgi:hypothetical protein
MVDPDAILCVAPEEAPALSGLAPLVVDLYAPRLLEGAWEGLQEEEARRALAAVDAADQVLVSNPRQRWFWSAILGLSGWDLSRPTGLVVPLVAEGLPRHRSRTRYFVAGGRPWPWQDARETVARAVAHLGERAEVRTFGMPPIPGALAAPLASRAAWLAACAGAVAALDRYAPNPERELAMSFRQADYVGCGLPLVTGEGPLAGAVRQFGAGWVDEPLEDALDAALSRDRGAAVAKLAARYRRRPAEAPLVAWSPARRERAWSAVSDGARTAEALSDARHAQARAQAAEAEVGAKRAEVAALVAQSQALTAAVERLAAAQADVAGFRREAVAVLGARLAGQTEEAEHLRRELEILRADLAKKNVELRLLQEERDRGLLGRVWGR